VFRMTLGKALATTSVVAALAVAPTKAAPIQDYLALGDSMAFGETDFTGNPSNGDRGYVSLYADYLAGKNGGGRPKGIKLGGDGEPSSTFFKGGPPNSSAAPAPGSPAPHLNVDYPSPAPTQNQLMLSAFSQEKAAGHVIGTVSVQLGANDLYAIANDPSFFSLTAAQQSARIAQTLASVQANDTALLSELKSMLPNAHVLMLGYHNPFNADPTSAIGRIADPAIKALNTLIAAEAKAFGATYVDTYSPFVGHELADTYIAGGNVHPTAAGYKLIAGQMEAVPEPASLLVMGAGFIGWLALGRRRRAARP
jgi:lysophospholipase L1-like esterase